MRPQRIGYNATISAPHMHAFALVIAQYNENSCNTECISYVKEFLKDQLKTAKRCLDVGSGSGYLTLAFAKLMEQPDAVAYGIEHIPGLVKDSITNIEK